MASVTIKSTYPDGEELLVQVRGGVAYPQALAELKLTAVAAYTDTLKLARVVDVAESDE
jgi:hypothetical protein